MTEEKNKPRCRWCNLRFQWIRQETRSRSLRWRLCLNQLNTKLVLFQLFYQAKYGLLI